MEWEWSWGEGGNVIIFLGFFRDNFCDSFNYVMFSFEEKNLESSFYGL